jgi:hypothetical protein
MAIQAELPILGPRLDFAAAFDEELDGLERRPESYREAYEARQRDTLPSLNPEAPARQQRSALNAMFDHFDGELTAVEDELNAFRQEICAKLDQTIKERDEALAKADATAKKATESLAEAGKEKWITRIFLVIGGIFIGAAASALASGSKSDDKVEE